MQFKKQRFLVTGCAGFIGSFITEELIKKGAFVFGLDDLSTGNIENIKPLLESSNFQFIKGNICDRKILGKLINQVDYIYHAAVQGLGLSVDNPITELKVNIEGTLLILELVRKSKVRRVVYASSASVYGDAQHFPEKENDPTFPLSPYGVSKLAAERYAIAYYKLYELPIVVLRYFNVYGPRQRWDSLYGGVVSIFLNKALRSKSLPVYGDGKQTRDFTYIDDAVKATLNAFTAKGILGQVINISAGKEYSVLELAQKVKKISGKNLKIKHVEKRLIDNITRRFGDTSLARKILNYSPSVNLEQGLRKTYQWWLNR